MDKFLVVGHSFPRRLKCYLQTKDITNFNLNQDTYRVGIWGRGGLNLKNVFDYINVISSSHTDCIILDLGANDLDSHSAPCPVSVAQELINFAIFLRTKSRSKFIYLVSQYRRQNPRRKDYNTVLQTFNAFIQQWCKKNSQDNIRFWPLRNLSDNWQQYQVDGVHFNDKGQHRYYRSVRGAILNARRQIVDNQQ